MNFGLLTTIPSVKIQANRFPVVYKKILLKDCGEAKEVCQDSKK